MKNNALSIRHQELGDNKYIVDYFLNADKDFLLKMGVDVTKLYERESWLRLLNENYYLEDEKKNIFYLIWLMDNQPIGHCNINKIKINDEAYMHLHLWQNNTRQKGLGLEFLKMSIPIFFEVFKLRKIYCEPYALNPAPNKTLAKFGFSYIKTYETIPGVINFYQAVNRWCLTKEKLELCSF